MKWTPIAALLLAVGAAYPMDVTLTPSTPSPSPVGALITFSANAAPTGRLWYRFRVRRVGQEYHVIRDYSPVSTLDWTAVAHDGAYDIEAAARDLDSGERGSTTVRYQFQSRVTAGDAVVSPTANPILFLYSAPACAAGSRMRVQFQAINGPVQTTPYQPCSPGLSMNFYLAGLWSETVYMAHHVVDTGATFAASPEVVFSTRVLPQGLFTDSVMVPSRDSSVDPFLLGGPLSANPVAYDLGGQVVWYGPPGMTFITRVTNNGEFWGIVETPGGDASQQVVRKFDLAGMTLLETNAARVNEQLKALGKRPITGFHHEARPIGGGRVAVLAGVEQIVTDIQGPGPVDVLGDMIVVLDSGLNVVWTWDAFDQLDVHRAAVLGEVCPAAGCPTFYQAPAANDWTHGNAVQETADGNLLFSARNQDWLVKIAYDAGEGDGHVIWRLGKDGDFQIVSSDPYPWFSHQHDGNFAAQDPAKLLVFDDGNTRVAALHGGASRGQVYLIDEENRKATPVLNANLGVYAAAVGSAQALPNGNYHFDAGFVQENGTIDSYSFELDGNGAIVYEAHQNTILYRTFRLADMYGSR